MTRIDHASRDRTSSRRFGGFTLIELLVVISIIALLIGILLPALSMARETARDGICNQNVRQIMTAVVAYATDANEFPRGLVDNDSNAVKADAANYAPITNPFGSTAPSNDVGVAMFLLLRQRYITSSELFVSPGLENHKPDPYGVTGDVKGQITFTVIGADIDQEANLSYGHHNPYFGRGNGVNGLGPHKLRLGNPELTSDYAVIADRGPGCCGNIDNDIANSSVASRSNIHLSGSNERGQHVAFGDGHAVFSDDHMIGPFRTSNRDNIYFADGAFSDSVPKTLQDVAIYPALTADR